MFIPLLLSADEVARDRQYFGRNDIPTQLLTPSRVAAMRALAIFRVKDHLHQSLDHDHYAELVLTGLTDPSLFPPEISEWMFPMIEIVMEYRLQQTYYQFVGGLEIDADPELEDVEETAFHMEQLDRLMAMPFGIDEIHASSLVTSASLEKALALEEDVTNPVDPPTQADLQHISAEDLDVLNKIERFLDLLEIDGALCEEEKLSLIELHCQLRTIQMTILAAWKAALSRTKNAPIRCRGL